MTRTILDRASDLEPIGQHIASALAALSRPWPTEAEILAIERRRRGQSERDARERRLRDSGIEPALRIDPRDIPRIVVGNLDDTAALDVVRAWRADPHARPWLLVCSLTGRGKTVAAGDSIAATGGTYVGMPELVRLVETAERPLADEFHDRAVAKRNALAECAYLVLDEFGNVDDRKAKAPFHWLVENRGARRTLVLGNVAAADIRARFKRQTLDQRTASRLAMLVHRTPPIEGFPEGSGFWDVGGADLRGAAA